MTEIIRSETVTKSWTVPIAGGFKPVTLRVDDEGTARFGVGDERTGPDAQELRAIARACNEAADTIHKNAEAG